MTRKQQSEAARKALLAHLANNPELSRAQAIDEALLALYGRLIKESKSEDS